MARTKGAKDKRKRKSRLIAGGIAGAAILGTGAALSNKGIRNRLNLRKRRKFKQQWDKKDVESNTYDTNTAKLYEKSAQELDGRKKRQKTEWVKDQAQMWREHQKKKAAGERSVYMLKPRSTGDYRKDAATMRRMQQRYENQVKERDATRKKRYLDTRKRVMGFSSPVFLSDF